MKRSAGLFEDRGLPVTVAHMRAVSDPRVVWGVIVQALR
jgi:hypothetical protein